MNVGTCNTVSTLDSNFWKLRHFFVRFSPLQRYDMRCSPDLTNGLEGGRRVLNLCPFQTRSQRDASWRVRWDHLLRAATMRERTSFQQTKLPTLYIMYRTVYCPFFARRKGVLDSFFLEAKSDDVELITDWTFWSLGGDLSRNPDDCSALSDTRCLNNLPQVAPLSSASRVSGVLFGEFRSHLRALVVPWRPLCATPSRGDTPLRRSPAPEKARVATLKMKKKRYRLCDRKNGNENPQGRQVDYRMWWEFISAINRGLYSLVEMASKVLNVLDFI